MVNCQLSIAKWGLILVVLLLVGCDVQRVDPVLKIGVVAPFEGEQRGIGYDIIYATRLAVREINEAGGINGYRLAMVAYDDSTWPDEAVNVANALVVDPGIVAVVGHWQPQTNEAAQPIYTSADLAYLPMGGGLGPVDPGALDAGFAERYQAITYQQSQPPGPWAGTAWDGMQLVFAAIEAASADGGDVNRSTINQALKTVEINGLTGTISLATSQP